MNSVQNDRQKQREEQEKEIKNRLAQIKRKILVMSGKGGVGKSSIAVSLAVCLSEAGYKVGLMDVDLHGPSIPHMLGIPSIHTPNISPDKSMGYSNGALVPARYNDHLSVVSIECVLEQVDSAVIWRGPLKISAIRQFIAEVAWQELDFLVIDSPPGTGDEPLTVAQTIPDAEALIVTTPQAVSLRDVRKSINFCKQVNMAIVGLIENMSGFVCPHCGKNTDLFSAGGGEQAAIQMAIPFLGRIPIIPGVVQASDSGIPPVSGSDAMQKAFKPICDAIVQKNTVNC